ncbi:hypothetical protein AC792_00345 [Arthrobacter sp. RIT-PI-e]|uniref:hypothetical protein n=1 Tax=Arthrobacter sp. RIT-PI-e TaxID=1681197 RepID=UPI000676AB2E|nr:hypothetical protein [Arthrobacter sp. RIT-PI-e]KNC20494.1 hypothetical protein AC792_00345 [Arthrobacter sp. RIT-PI-e]
MRSRPTTLLGSALLLLGALSITGCDDTQLPQIPGVEEQDTENQEDSGDQDDGDDDEEQDAEQDTEGGEEDE